MSEPTETPSWGAILTLALPALGALVAEPLYVLGDTAIVGRLGALPLAGLALGGLLLGEVLGLCTFLEYGTTAKAARLAGAGDEQGAYDIGVQATWIALALGLVAIVLLELAAAPVLDLMSQGNADHAAVALRWFRVAALGSPFVLIIAASQGWLRALKDTRTGFLVLVASNVLSVVLSAVLVLGFDLGVVGSAVANVVAQLLGALVFLALLRRRATRLRPQLAVLLSQLAAARDLGIRSFAFAASFLIAASIASGMGTAQLDAHQIGFQLWILIALALDALAIAGQALIGNLLGAGSLDAADRLARKLLIGGTLFGAGVGALMAAGYDVIPALFSSDHDVRDQARIVWPWLVGTLPVAGALFALDGVFFGAGDLRFMRTVTLAAAVGGLIPMLILTARMGLGLGGIWAGIALFIGIRAVAGLLRWRSKRWLVAGTELADVAS